MRTSSSPKMWSAWGWVKTMASTRGSPKRSACARRSVGVSTSTTPRLHLQLQPRPPALVPRVVRAADGAVAADDRNAGRGAAAEHGDAHDMGGGVSQAPATPPPGSGTRHPAAAPRRRPPARPAARGNARAGARRALRPAAARRSARMAASGRAARCLKLVCERRRSVEWTMPVGQRARDGPDQEAHRRALRQPAPEAVLPVAVVSPSPWTAR